MTLVLEVRIHVQDTLTRCRYCVEGIWSQPECLTSHLAPRPCQVVDYLGHAAFSRAVQALDTKTNRYVCLKIIKNNKDYFDQSLDEVCYPHVSAP